MSYQYVSKDELYADIADYERGLAYRLAKEADAYYNEYRPDSEYARV